jgi:two-component system, LytTR family, sensor kinase
MKQNIPPLFQNTSTLPPLMEYIAKRRWIYHLFFWALFVVVSIFSDWNFLITSNLNFLNLFIVLFIIILGSYVQALLLMPYYLYQKQYTQFILGSLGIYIIQSWINYKISLYLYLQNKAYIDSLTTIQINIDDASYFDGSATFVFYLLFVPSVKLLKDIYLYQQQQQLLEKDNIERDLKLLKGQLSPHLLFNTLNNLYGLALQKSDTLPPLMLRLSEVMRYSLYETNQTYVNLNQEITYLKNYIELEKLRIGTDIKIMVYLPENVGSSVEIAPMLMIVFIENAFKHSRHAPKNNRFINIKLMVEGSSILFNIENSFSTQNDYFQYSNEKNSGIGLELTN